MPRPNFRLFPFYRVLDQWFLTRECRRPRLRELATEAHDRAGRSAGVIHDLKTEFIALCKRDLVTCVTEHGCCAVGWDSDDE